MIRNKKWKWKWNHNEREKKWIPKKIEKKKNCPAKEPEKKIIQMTRGHTTRKLNEKYLKLIIYYEWNKDEKKNYDGIIKKNFTEK